MTFGPFILRDVRVVSDSLVLDLANENTGPILHSPKRFISFDRTEEEQSLSKRHAESLIDSLVTTETARPWVNLPSQWWKSVSKYKVSTATTQPIPNSADQGEKEAFLASSSMVDSQPPGDYVEEHEVVLTKGPKSRSSPVFSNVTKVYGPPGTGKTHRLMGEIQKALDDGVHPSMIGFFSFTNKATNEAKERMVKLFPKFNIDEDFPYFQTLHSLAYGSLRTRVAVMTEVQAKEFDQSVLIDRVLMKEGDESSQVDRVKHPVIDAASTAHAKQVPLDQYLRTLPESQRWPINKWVGRPMNQWNAPLSERDLARCLAYNSRYIKYKAQLGVIDYGDMLERAAMDGEGLPCLSVLLIDEAQDLSPIQWDIVRKLIERAERCFIAGDDDQAICESFGASAEEFVNLKVTNDDVVLPDSRRIPPNVHQALKPLVDRLDGQSPNRKKKNWTPKSDGSTGEVGAFASIEKFLTSPQFRRSLEASKSVMLMFATNGSLQKVSKLLTNEGLAHFAANRLIGEGQPNVRLLTVWGAKGGQAQVTALISESKRDKKMLAEDARLEYVAHTRAMESFYYVGEQWATLTSEKRVNASVTLPTQVKPVVPAPLLTEARNLAPGSANRLLEKYRKS